VSVDAFIIDKQICSEKAEEILQKSCNRPTSDWTAQRWRHFTALCNVRLVSLQCFFFICKQTYAAVICYNFLHKFLTTISVAFTSVLKLNTAAQYQITHTSMKHLVQNRSICYTILQEVYRLESTSLKVW